MFYLGGGITYNNVNASEVFGPKISGTSWSAYVGIRPISLFAVEADYFDLGSHTELVVPILLGCGLAGSNCDVSSQTNAKAFAGYAVGFLPLSVPYLDVYGKVGIGRYKLHETTCVCGGLAPNMFTSASDNSNAFTWGAGVQAHLGMLGGRLEYVGFNKGSTSIFSLSQFLNL
jgi:opacity protein-like surface antigen